MLVVLHSADLPPDLEDRLAAAGLDAKIRYATASELAGALRGADALLVWDFTIGDAVRTSWPAADTLRWVHTASAGVDRLMFDEL
ncbi:MAG TPA: D-2-hydroxyacid dehydrogenase, partial [Pseudonocardiaceae bacterium]